MKAPLLELSVCAGCAAPIVWCETSTGVQMPVDAVAVPDGNLVLYPGKRLCALALVVSAKLKPPSDMPRYRSHFATCPKASSFRTAPRKRRAR